MIINVEGKNLHYNTHFLPLDRSWNLLRIIALSEKRFNFEDLEIEVEYQGKETIGKYNLDFDGTHFLLTSKITACLATDACGIPTEKPKVAIAEAQSSCCDPSEGCC